MKCIYCQMNLINDGSNEELSSSNEHIIQEAIGGTNATLTPDCCTKCNSNLGTKIDAPFVESLLIKTLRVKHAIPTKKGKMPSYKFSAKSTNSEKDLGVTFSAGHELDISVKPNVLKEPISDKAQIINVSASPEKAEEIYKGILKKADLKGQKLWTSTGQAVSNVSDVMQSGTSKPIGEVKGELSVNLEEIFRGFSKIAFGFAHLLLGSSWTFSQEAGTLRLSATGQGDYFKEIDPIILSTKSHIRSILIPPAQDTNRHHLVAIIPHENNAHILVSLFGGEAGNYLFNIGDFNKVFKKDLVEKSAIFLDPITKEVRWLGLINMIAN